MPLLDAAPLIVAKELGFAAEEGLAFDLVPAPSWSALRDWLELGTVDAAHMLAPVPVAGALGLGGSGAALSAVSVLSINGTVIGVSRSIAHRMREDGHGFDFSDASAAGRALIAASRPPLRIGVPFPFSMHSELVFYWLTALGLPAPQNLALRTIPPPLMAEAIEADEIDAFCVGEPWGSKAVENGVGELLLPGAAIWAFAPEKILAVRDDRIERDRDTILRLVRSVVRANEWLGDPVSRLMAADLLARREWLDLPGEILDRAMSGRMTIRPEGDTRSVPALIEFQRGAATFPWRSQGEWIARRLAGRVGLNATDAARRGRARFRSDIYRDAMADTAADLPGASVKIEGAVAQDTAVASRFGSLILPRDAFFDGSTFEPLLND